MKTFAGIREIREAACAISPLIIRTPCARSDELSRVFGRPVYLKLENLQVTGAFKIRGNAYKLSKLSSAELKRGLVTASSGNHGLGLSLSAFRRGVRARIYVPSRTPGNKIRKLKGYGAQVAVGGGAYDDAVSKALNAAREEGLVYVPSFDDADIIIGNATMGLEIFEDVPDTGMVVVPVGGGGGISGISLALKDLSPSVKIVGVEAAGADSMRASLAAGSRILLDKADTIADGIAVREPGRLTFAVVRELVNDVVSVSDREIKAAVSLLAGSAKIVAEPAGAAAVAGLEKVSPLPEGPVVCLVSGGNIDAKLLSSLL